MTAKKKAGLAARKNKKRGRNQGESGAWAGKR